MYMTGRMNTGSDRYSYSHGVWEGTADEGTLLVPRILGIYDANGLLVGGTGDVGGVGESAESAFTPGTTGTYYVAAQSHDDKMGTYTLWVRTAGSEPIDGDVASSTSTTGLVRVGESVRGVFGSGSDRDWYQVTLEANKTYRFDLDIPGEEQLGSGGAFVLLRDPTGSEIANYSDTDTQIGTNDQENTVQYTPTTAGVYYVDLATFFTSGYDYTLSVDEL